MLFPTDIEAVLGRFYALQALNAKVIEHRPAEAKEKAG
jgi:hypothetical protein